MFETTKKKVADWYGVQRLRFRYYISSFLIGSGIVYCVVGAILLLSSLFYRYLLLIPAVISICIGLALWKYRTEWARRALLCWVVFFCIVFVVLMIFLIMESRRSSDYFQVLGVFLALAGPSFVAVTRGSVLFGRGAPTHAEVKGHYLNRDLSALTVYRPDPAAEPKGESKVFAFCIRLVGYFFSIALFIGVGILAIALIGGVVGRFSNRQCTIPSPKVEQSTSRRNFLVQRWEEMTPYQRDEFKRGLIDMGWFIIDRLVSE